MNDNPVILAETHLRLNVSENTPVGTELTRINATDKDIGLNGKVKIKFLRKFFYFFLFDRFIILSVMVFRRRVGWIISVLEIQLECMMKRIFGKSFFFFSI
jgi:hypothetical protein